MQKVNPWKRDSGAVTDTGGASASPDFLASEPRPAGAFRVTVPDMGQRWGGSAGYPMGEAEPYDGFKPVGLIRQPQSPTTAPLIQSKILKTKADWEVRQAEIEKRLEVPAIIGHMEASRKREQEAEAQINAYMETLNKPMPEMPDQIRANEGEALAGILGSLLGVRGDRAAGSVAGIAGRRQQIGFQNQMAQDQAMRDRARLGIDLEQSRAETAGRRADSAMEFMARVREAAANRTFAEEDWQRGRVAQLEDIETERNWNREVMNWDKSTAIEKMKLADQLQLDSQKAIGKFEQEVLAPLKIRNDARAEGIGLAMKTLLENRDPAAVTTLMRGMKAQGIDLPSGWQSLMMAIAVANRDDAAFKKTMEDRASQIQMGMLNLEVRQANRQDALAGAELAGAGISAPSLQGGLRPLPGNLPGAGGLGQSEPMYQIGPPMPTVVKNDDGSIRVTLVDAPMPAVSGAKVGSMVEAANAVFAAKDDLAEAELKIAEYQEALKKDGVSSLDVLPPSLTKARREAQQAYDAAKVKHRTALSEARGEKGNQEFWNWVELWRLKALEAIKGLGELDEPEAVKKRRQALVRQEFAKATGVSIDDVPGKRIK